MTVTSEKNRIDHQGDGTTTVFTYDFKIFRNENLKVWLSVTDAGTGQVTDTPQTLSSDYTVQGAGDNDGGSITFVTAPTAEQEVIIKRVLRFVQELDLPGETGELPSTPMEDQYDYITMLTQQLNEQAGRAVTGGESVPTGEGGVTLTGPVQVNHATVWAPDGSLVTYPQSLDSLGGPPGPVGPPGIIIGSKTIDSTDYVMTAEDDGYLIFLRANSAPVNITTYSAPREGYAVWVYANNINQGASLVLSPGQSLQREANGNNPESGPFPFNIGQCWQLTYGAGAWRVLSGDRIVTARLLDNAVTLAKLASEAGAGALCYDASGAANRVASTASDQGKSLVVNASGVPEWSASNVGGLALIETRVVSSVEATVDFTGLSDYFTVKVEIKAVPNQSGRWQCLLGDDTGFTPGNLAYVSGYDLFGAVGGTSNTAWDFNAGSGAGENPQPASESSGVMLIEGMGSQRPTMSWVGQIPSGGTWGHGAVRQPSPNYNNIEQIRFQRQGGGNWISGGTFNLYGLRRGSA